MTRARTGTGPRLEERIVAGRVETFWTDDDATRAPPPYADDPSRKQRGPTAPQVVARPAFENRKIDPAAPVDVSQALADWMKTTKVV